MLSTISSGLPKDSRFRARFEAPVQPGEFTLPPGTIFEGHLEPTPARRMIRSGALRLVFDRMILPDGSIRSISPALTSVQDRSMRTDIEGTIRPRRSKKRMLFQIAGTLMIAKVADDISEVATTSVTKGLARFIGLGAGVGFVLLRKGSEVTVPEGTAIEVMFGRNGEILPLDLAAAPSNNSPPEKTPIEKRIQEYDPK